MNSFRKEKGKIIPKLIINLDKLEVEVIIIFNKIRLIIYY